MVVNYWTKEKGWHQIEGPIVGNIADLMDLPDMPKEEYKAHMNGTFDYAARDARIRRECEEEIRKDYRFSFAWFLLEEFYDWFVRVVKWCISKWKV